MKVRFKNGMEAVYTYNRHGDFWRKTFGSEPILEERGWSRPVFTLAPWCFHTARSGVYKNKETYNCARVVELEPEERKQFGDWMRRGTYSAYRWIGEKHPYLRANHVS